jgi:hypothetical protein
MGAAYGEATGRAEENDMTGREHWERVYRTKAAAAVSWYQREPVMSLR